MLDMFNNSDIEKDINILEIPVVYLTIEKNKERQLYINNELKKYGFKKIIKCNGFEGIIDEQSTINKWQQKQYVFACNRSYLKGLLLQDPPFIFLEDDAKIFHNNFLDKIQIPENSDFIYLGGSSERFIDWETVEEINEKNPFLQTKNKNILRVNNQMTSTHAFLILNKKIRDDLVKRLTLEMHLSFDYVIAKMHNDYNFYAYNLPIFHQIMKNSLDPYKVIR